MWIGGWLGDAGEACAFSEVGWHMEIIRGKTCAITGGTSGLGRATALALGALGANLVLIGRNQRAAQSVITRIRRIQGAGGVEFLPADLSNLADVRSLATELRRRCAVLDVLVNNAGARFDRYQTSADGVELTFATNHLGHFLLTALLLDRLLAADGGRVVSVASGAHASAIEHGWILRADNYDRKAAYAASKLANIMFTYELARRLHGTRVECNAVDPGGVATHLGRNNGLVAWLKHLAYYAMHGTLQSPGHGCQTIVHLSSRGTEGLSGKYYGRFKEIRSSDLSYDQKAAGDLWDLSVSLAGLDARLGPAWEIFGPQAGDKS
jgi:NAD(P)-dependent dehydrogenase (short-subunit alcohol dehydrogenase family)